MSLVKKTFDLHDFLPVSAADIESRGWRFYDILLVTGDAYADHPSFGAAVISRLLEDAGYRVAILAQPDWKSAAAFRAMGRPRLAAFITSGNIDSMVAHYTAAKKKRSEDSYSPGGAAGKRPNRAVIAYSGRVREAFPGLPVVIGGLEASLRRFAHYDYWDDAVRRSILVDSGADALVYGMGERASLELAAAFVALLPKKKKSSRAAETPSEQADNGGGNRPDESSLLERALSSIRGICYMAARAPEESGTAFCGSFEEVAGDKAVFARSAMLQFDMHDPVRGVPVAQRHGDVHLVQNPPAMPLDTAELDRVYGLPFTRAAHPTYDELGGVPALAEVGCSIIHNRGCFGGCNFCSLAFHQGRMVTARSHESVLREAVSITQMPEFKGYIHDVGGPTANFRAAACREQKTRGVCARKRCLEPCKSLRVSHSDYLSLLRKVRAVPGVKKVFVRSGIRYDYVMLDRDRTFLSELVRHHVSGQLKVAPEHCVDSVLDYMGKPNFEVYKRFSQSFETLCKRYGLPQFLVPYLISSHPGCTLGDAVQLAERLNAEGIHPEQVQDFYPTPGTLSTCMYHTGLDPRTMRPVYVPREPREKAMQRALLQWKLPQNRPLVLAALKSAGREDLIGASARCLVNDRGAYYNRKPVKQTGQPSRGKAASNSRNAKPTPQNRKDKPAVERAGRGKVENISKKSKRR